MKSAEQKARDMLERLGMPDAQSMTAGDLVELANLIADNDRDVLRYRWLREQVKTPEGSSRGEFDQAVDQAMVAEKSAKRAKVE